MGCQFYLFFEGPVYFLDKACHGPVWDRRGPAFDRTCLTPGVAETVMAGALLKMLCQTFLGRRHNNNMASSRKPFYMNTPPSQNLQRQGEEGTT